MNRTDISNVINKLLRIKENAILEVTGFAWKTSAIDEAIALILEQRTEIAKLKYYLDLENTEKTNKNE